MGKYNFAALRVRQTALRQKAADKISKLPQWTQIVADIPPSEVLVRHQPVQHELVRERVKTSSPGLTHPQTVFEIDPKPRSRSKKSSHLFLPLKIRYEEDELRRDFFRDHPWELARSRILLESTGRDHERYDWSKLQQPGKRLDGESVVQRQLWLLNNVPNMTKGAAYDIARREFYQLRLREDIQRRVAAEEAESTGAQWGRRMLDVGMELENQEYENWKEWAKLQAQLMEQKTAAFIGAPEVAQTDQSASQNAEPATERA